MQFRNANMSETIGGKKYNSFSNKTPGISPRCLTFDIHQMRRRNRVVKSDSSNSGNAEPELMEKDRGGRKYPGP